MNKPVCEYRHLLATFLYLAGVAAGPLPAAEPAEVAAQPTEVIETGAPVIPLLIERVLADPDLDYASTRGPDDCSSEPLYDTAKDMLGKYVEDPGTNGSLLKEYILSGEKQCNCTAAIVGADFELLLTQLGTDLSSVPCL